ncbi:hypothetical protein BsWGS_27056 [Bradybaena similaris]
MSEENKFDVFIEKEVLEKYFLQHNEKFKRVKGRLEVFNDGVDDLTDKVDFIICVGGAGTLLYVSSLFQVEDDS